MQLFLALQAINGVSRVCDRNGIEKIVVNDPWRVAHPGVISLSQALAGFGAVLVALAALTNLAVVFGFASIIFMLAMLVRIIAPRLSGLSTWNDFVVLGDARDFAPSATQAAHETRDAALRPPLDAPQGDFLPVSTKVVLAGLYALHTSDRNVSQNGTETFGKAVMRFADGWILLSAAEALWNMRKTARLFFAICTGLGMLSVVGALMWDDARPRTAALLTGPFTFLVGPILYSLSAPKTLRGRILPYQGRLLMHQSPSLNRIMTNKVCLNYVASALVMVHVWLIAALGRYLSAKTADPVVESFYPTPAPQPEYILVVVPFSILSGLIFANAPDTFLAVAVTVGLPGIISFGALFMGNATDIVRFLSEGSNRYVFLEPDLAVKASGIFSTPQEDLSVHREALQAASELDRSLEGLFAKEGVQLPHRSTGTQTSTRPEVNNTK